MVGIAAAAGHGPRSGNVELAQAEAPEFEHVNWKTQPNMKTLYFWCAILCVASATTGYDGMMMNNSQSFPAWESYFDTPEGSKLGLMNNAYNLGSIASLFIVPYVADWFGRRLPIAIGCVIMVIGGIVSTVSTRGNWGTYLAGRLILGFGGSMAQICSPILLTEIAHPQHRARFTAVYNCLWNLGALFCSLIAFGTQYVKNDWSWKSVTLLQIVPSVIQLAFIFWIPESPRWLINKDRSDEALSMLAYYHAAGDQNNATVQFEFQEIKETMRLEKEAEAGSSYIDFLKTKGNRWRLAILISLGIISQYSGNALFSNYSNLIYEGAGIKTAGQKLGLNVGNTALSLIISITSATLIDRAGRRRLFLIGTTGMVVMFTLWTITSAVYENSGNTNKAAGYVQIPIIWIFGVFYAISWSGLLVAYALEILPFRLRAKGLMIMNITVQAILAIGNQTNPVAWKNLKKHWYFTLFYTIWITLELIWVYFVYVETKGPTLEEIAKIFDGEDAVAHIDINEVRKDGGVSHFDEKAQGQHNVTAL
jgi:sugar porter (SP) family MFS transporter